MKDYNYKLLTAENIAIHVASKEEAELLLAWAHKQGLKWGSGQSYLKEINYTYHSNQVYCLNRGSFGATSSYGSSTILKLSDHINRIKD